VLAYGAAAVPETLGGAGVCFTPKDLELAAEWLAELVYNESLRQQILDGQRRRMAAFSPDAVEADVKAVLDSLGRIESHPS
jgi:glycosyltransferase involved in cell wall biosynthesis